MDIKNIEMNVVNLHEVVKFTGEIVQRMDNKEIDAIDVYYQQIGKQVISVRENIAQEIKSLENNFLDEGVIRVLGKNALGDDQLRSQVTFRFTKDFIYLIVLDTLVGTEKQCYGKFNRKGELVEHLAYKDMFRNKQVLDLLSGGEVKEYSIEGFFRNALTILIVVNKLATTRQEILREKSKRIVNLSSKKKKKSKGSKKTKLIRTYSIYLSNDTETVENEDKRQYSRQSECWSVKGFPRKYKSGKVVWIKPHVRGKGKKEGKTYQI